MFIHFDSKSGLLTSEVDVPPAAINSDHFLPSGTSNTTARTLALASKSLIFSLRSSRPVQSPSRSLGRHAELEALLAEVASCSMPSEVSG